MKKLLIALLVLSSAFPAHADKGRFTAKADRQELYEGQHLKLILTLKGEDVSYELPFPRPDLLPYLDFQRSMGPSTSRKISIVNGKMSKWNQVKLIHVYVARKAGKLTIPALEYTCNGRTYKTDPIEVRIKRMPQRPKTKDKGEWSPPTDPYLETRLDHEEVYVNQRVTASWYLYSRRPVVEWRPRRTPAVGNFLSKTLRRSSHIKPVTQKFNGRRWNIAFLQSMILYPIQEGELRIDPLGIVYQVPGQSRNFLGGRVMRQGSISSKRRTIQVKPLPEEGRSSDFSGAVGRFEIMLSENEDTLRENTPFEFTVIVKGTGHPDFISAPGMDVPGNFDLHQDSADKRIEETGSEAVTTCKFKMYLVPREKGEFELGPFRFPYFDVREEKYKTAETGKINLTVLAGEEPLPAKDSSEKEPEVIAPLGKDLRYIKTGADMDDREQWLLASPATAVLQVLPLLLVAGTLVMRRRKDRLLHDAGLARKQRAGKRCRKALRAARKAEREGNVPEVCSLVYRALTGFIGDSFGRPDSCMTTVEAVDTLRSHGASEDTIKMVREILDECDRARFAPATVTPEDASRLLQRLREAMGKVSREARE